MTGSANEHNLTLHRAITGDERQAVQRLRYEVYIEELARHRNDADSERRIITDSWDESAYIYYVTAGDQIVGTVRFNLCSTIIVDDEFRSALLLDRFLGQFAPDQLAISSQFVIQPEWRTSPVASMLVEKCYRDARDLGLQFDFQRCSPALIRLYEHLGYRRYTRNLIHSVAGFRVPMVNVLEDIDHLRRVRSPYWRIARSLDNRREPAQWFNAEFPAQFKYLNSRTTSTKQLYETLTEFFHSPPAHEIHLFQGLEEQDVASLLRNAVMHKVSAGETLIRPGDPGTELFIVLSGMVEAVGEVKGDEVTLRTMGQGEMIGEIAAFTHGLRTARVIATVDSEVLILTQQSLLQAASSSPSVTTKLLLNIIRTLASRLNDKARVNDEETE